MKTTRLVAAGLALASLGLSAGASAQGWNGGPRSGQTIGRDAPPPPPRPDDRRFDDRRDDGRGYDGRGYDGRGDDRRFDDRRYDDRRFADRGRGFGPDRGWGRDGRRGYRGGNRCWIEHRRDGRVTVCR